MKYFLIEGMFYNPIPVGGIELDVLIHEHLKRLEEKVTEGKILFAGPKRDNSGVIIVMKGESSAEIEEFLNNCPLTIKKVQYYKITEFKCKNANEKVLNWFE